MTRTIRYQSLRLFYWFVGACRGLVVWGLGFKLHPSKWKRVSTRSATRIAKLLLTRPLRFDTFFQRPPGLLILSVRLHVALLNKSNVFYNDLAFKWHVFSECLLEFWTLPQEPIEKSSFGGSGFELHSSVCNYFQRKNNTDCDFAPQCRYQLF